MSTTQMPLEERLRMLALRDYALHDSPQDECCAHIVALAAEVCAAPFAWISLVDTDRQWLLAAHGLPAATGELPGYALRLPAPTDSEAFEIHDTLGEAGLHTHPLVAAGPRIRSYADLPLVTSTGQCIGVLAVLGPQPRSLSARHWQSLTHLARMAMALLERHRLTAALRQSEQRFALMNQGADIGLWDWDVEHKRFHASRRMLAMLGHDPDAGIAAPPLWANSVHPDDAGRVADTLMQLRSGTAAALDMEFRVRHQGSGSWIWIAVRGAVQRDAQGALLRVAGSLMDVTGLRRSDERLGHLMHFDALTRLPNRHQVCQRLTVALDHAALAADVQVDGGASGKVGVILIGLESFRQFEREYGLRVGERLLYVAGQRLGTSLRSGEFIGRIGSAEFAVVIDRLATPAEAAERAQQLLARLAEPVEQEGRQLQLSANAGIALYPDDAHSTDALLGCAGLALHHACRQGPGRWLRHTPELAASAGGQDYIAAQLRGALLRGELSLRYQAQLDLASNRIRGAEALLYWNHPHLGQVGPDRLTELLEQHAAALPISLWVLEQACLQIRLWQRSGLDAPPVVINLTARQFHEPGLDTDVEALLSATGVTAGQIELQISESTLAANPAHSVATLRQLRRLGVRLAIGDFGGGRCSLRQLLQLPLQLLKIDRHLVAELATTPDGGAPAVLRAIADLGRALQLYVVADGIDSQAQAQLLAGTGCHALQGWHCSVPLDAAGFAQLLRGVHGRGSFPASAAALQLETAQQPGEESETLSPLTHRSG